MFTRRAYRVRSGIVHSGDLSEGEMRRLNGEPATSEQFADDLEAVVRHALKKATRLVANRERFPPDWDDLMFFERRGTASGITDESSI